MQGLTITAPAKVNLFLGIGGVRPDGHHDVESIFQTLELHDTIHLTPSDELTLHCDEELGIAPEHNLAFRAARAFSAAYDVDVLVDIAIEKRIPAGAGLAGGSSDAAAVLAGLAYWASLPLDDHRLQAVARSLGADVPFFLYGGAALMRGRGDELVSRLPDVLFDLAIVKPDVPGFHRRGVPGVRRESAAVGGPASRGRGAAERVGRAGAWRGALEQHDRGVGVARARSRRYSGVDGAAAGRVRGSCRRQRFVGIRGVREPGGRRAHRGRGRGARVVVALRPGPVPPA